MTVSWSEIPGAFPVDLISDGLFVNTRSNMFPSLVGLSCIWVSPYSDVMSNSACCTSRSEAPVLISIFTQSISGQLKSPAIMTCLGFPFVNLSSESLMLFRSFMFLCGISNEAMCRSLLFLSLTFDHSISHSVIMLVFSVEIMSS